MRRSRSFRERCSIRNFPETVGDPGAGGREFRRDQDQLAPFEPIRLAPFGALDRMDPREVEGPAADRETTSFDLETGAGPGGGSRRQESSEHQYRTHIGAAW